MEKGIVVEDNDSEIDRENNWIVETKFEPSRPKIDLVDRERLLELLDAATDRKLALVVAPAGFGKSTLLCQWFEQRASNDTKMAWVSLDQNDGDASQFLSNITISLAYAGLDLGDLEIGARNGFSDSTTSNILIHLMKKIQNIKSPSVLVLDDYHRVSSVEVDNIIKIIIRDMPDNFTIVINSRIIPSIDIPILVASGDAIEIPPVLIRLTKEETRIALGDKVSNEDCDEIFDQTEGWPVAVQLARVQKHARPNAPLQKASSSNLVASYLTNQVLSTVDDDVREFLLTVSTLEQFNPELSNAVMERNDSWRLIEKLEPLTALLIALDIEGNWFRLHHLFAEYLRETLRKESPTKLEPILKNASAWYVQQGFLIEAVKYASFAGDFENCEELILKAGGWKIILTEGIGVLRALIRLMPEHIVSSSARLLVARAYLHCKEGEYHEARGLLDASILLRSDIDAEAYDRDHKVIESLIHAYEDKNSWAINNAKDDIDEIARNFDSLEAATLICQYTLIYFSIGDMSRTDNAIRQAFKYMRVSGSVLGLNYCYIHAGVAALYRAEFDLAQANISQALELSESNFGSDSGLKHLAQVLNYSLNVWTGQASKDDIDDFSRVLSYIEEYDGWAEIYLVGLDAAYHLAEQCADYEFANDVINRFLIVSRNRQLGRLELFCNTLAMRAASRHGYKKDAQDLSNPIKEWVARGNPTKEPRDWQTYVLAASTLSITRLMSAGLAMEALRLAGEHCENNELLLHKIRLLVAKSIAIRQNGRHDESQKIMISALRFAARQKILGPFLCDDIMRKFLKEIRGYLKSHDEDLILINFVAQILNRMHELRPRPVSEILSAREYEILEQLAMGQANKDIARRFELTENTVKFHLKNLYAKLDVNSRTQAIAAANKMKLLD